MGTIDLDPCSEAVFEPVICAARAYSLLERNEDGLTLPWSGNVLCNPPGGAVIQFWERALSTDCSKMIWIGFSVEQLCIMADLPVHPTDFAICYLRSRIDFKRHDGYRGSPSHGNYVTAVGVERAVFEREFAALGKIQYGQFA